MQDSNVDEEISDVIEKKHPANVAPSIVDLLKQDFEELAEHEDAYIPIMGYENTGLQVRYRMPGNGKELDNIARNNMRKHKDAFTRNVNIAIDTMIHLCAGLYVQPPDLGDNGADPNVKYELDPANSGHPVGFDGNLAEIMGWEGADTIASRDVVRKLFGKNDMAIMSHFERLNRWLVNTKADLTSEIWQMGE